MSNQEFQSKRFTAPVERVHWLTALLSRHVPQDKALRVLDLGCGSGEQLFDLAEKMPLAHFTGVDVSEPNITAAQHDPRNAALAGRLNFIKVDYLEFIAEPFDVIISDSVLHNIPSASEPLFAKVAGDLAEGGLLVMTLPYPCAFNKTLWGIRRLFRICAGTWTDRLILFLGRLLHGQEMSEALLLERVHYMYLIPYCQDDFTLRRLLLGRLELRLLADYLLPHASIAQPKHRASVWHKADR